jgi:small subunit ribosomal protein S19e
MTDPVEVPPSVFLPKLAEELRKIEAVKPPSWASFARTGVHTERAPTQTDWWYLRSASVLRKLYTKGPTGVSRLAAEYGGRSDRGSAPYHAVKGSRSVAQEIVKQLEKAGLVAPLKLRGRRISPKGQSLLQKVTRETFQTLLDKDPSLKKYL